ncbi:YciI-like protein [Paraburkholderia acidipaludis]|uniref:YciI-like protein n=1 Tax=Paraburkholderia acidipaludis TaxID=660537 RepID=UPI000484F315|nr:YciI-like protein [Paraburkholderia acidipaludis]
MHWLLMYELAEDYLERRPEHRNAHLALAWAAAQRGELLLAGAVADPVDSALLLFQGETPAAAEAFARADPYVTAGLVRSWRVRPWQTVAGEHAANPVR